MSQRQSNVNAYEQSSAGRETAIIVLPLSSIYRHIYKPYYKRRIVPPRHINFSRVHFKTTLSRGHMSIAAQPSLWPDIKGPSRREGWLRAAMEPADSLINQTRKQRGAGLGSDMRHWLVARTVAKCNSLPPPAPPNHCFPTKLSLIKHPPPPVDSIGNVYLFHCVCLLLY